MQGKHLIRALILLGCREFLFTATLSIGNTLAGLVGSMLTPNPNLATAPYAVMTLATAVVRVLASLSDRPSSRARAKAAGSMRLPG
jgi:hypothetical protein